MKKTNVKYFGALLLCSLLTTSSCKKEQKVVKPIKVEFKKEGELQVYQNANDSIIATFNIEIADTDYERQTGLMYRPYMEDNQAMLFIFPNTDYRSFFMKNTEIPLDIIYFDQDGQLVNIVENAKPYDENSLPSTAPAKYVLEVNAGLSRKLGISEGVRIEFSEIE